MHDNLEAALRQFSADVVGIYGGDLLAVVLYGSAASEEFVSGKSNINCLLLLKEVTPRQLKKCSGHLKKWHSESMSTPLFVDPAYVDSSVDVFPIEFLDMKQRYRILHGQDFLRDLRVKPEHLRFQCEQELKGKMLKLRQMYLEGSGSEARLTGLMAKSIGTFMVFFRALLFLKHMPAPHSANDILDGLSKLGLRVAAMRRVDDLKRKANSPGALEALDSLFAEYLHEIQAAVDYVDTLRDG
jgi:hypothetical protein